MGMRPPPDQKCTSINLCIAEITIHLQHGLGPIEEILPKHTHALVIDGDTEAYYRVDIDDNPTLYPQVPAFETNSGWQVYSRNGQWILRIGSSENRTLALLSAQDDFLMGDIYLSPITRKHLDKASLKIMPRIVHFLLLGLLGNGRGLMLHASGVKSEDVGWLFAGTDGVGKSTMAQLWSQYGSAEILGDDQIIIRQKSSRIWMYSMPTPRQETEGFVTYALPIQHLLILKQGRDNQLRQLSPVEATAALLKRSFPPAWFPRGMAYTVEFLSQVATMMPIYEYAFVPDRSAVDYLQECAGSL